MKGQCPKGDSLVRLFMNETSPRETEKLLRHMASCSRCSFSFHLLRQVKGDLYRQVNDFADSRDDARGLEELRRSALSKMGEEVDGPGPSASRNRPHGMTFGLRFAVSLLSVVLVLATGGYLAVKRIQKHSGIRSSSAQLALLSPTGTIRTVPDRFRWTSVSSAEDYHLELFDDSLNRIYEISTFLINEAVIPSEIRSGLQRGRAYVWSVTAKDRDSTLLATRSGTFVIN
jgi:hypothetical protein